MKINQTKEAIQSFRKFCQSMDRFINQTYSLEKLCRFGFAEEREMKNEAFHIANEIYSHMSLMANFNPEAFTQYVVFSEIELEWVTRRSKVNPERMAYYALHPLIESVAFRRLKQTHKKQKQLTVSA